jgi:hypothetical protein
MEACYLSDADEPRTKFAEPAAEPNRLLSVSWRDLIRAANKGFVFHCEMEICFSEASG